MSHRQGGEERGGHHEAHGMIKAYLCIDLFYMYVHMRLFQRRILQVTTSGQRPATGPPTSAAAP